jgi:catechol 2,3-dioxygenase-like lactoylglutathione lyase family enzyme
MIKTRLLDHIDLRVTDIQAAAKFYGKFLPQIGFVREKYEPPPEGSAGDTYDTFYSVGGDKPSEFFGLTEDKNHRPNNTRISFWADSREKVDEIAKLVREAGGRNLEGPEVVPDYTPGYYAFFFEDPDGNKLEICCRANPVIAE